MKSISLCHRFSLRWRLWRKFEGPNPAKGNLFLSAFHRIAIGRLSRYTSLPSEYDITFICRKERQYFAEPILKELQKSYKIQILLLDHKRELSARKIKGRIVWIEWAAKFAWAVSKLKLENKKVIIRLHRYELDTAFMQKIKWENIDGVVFVNKHIEREFKQKINDRVRTHTIPNALAVQDFPYFPPGRCDGDTRIISYSMTFDPLKGYLELIRFFKKLLNRSPSFKLTLMARDPQSREEKYYLRTLRLEVEKLAIEDRVDFLVKEMPLNLKDDRKNVSQVLSQHDIFIGFSKIESFHYAFAESMLSGLQCFYNGWQNFYLEEFWKSWAYSSEEEMLEGIIQWRKRSVAERAEITRKNRDYTVKRFGSATISEIYRQVFFKI